MKIDTFNVAFDVNHKKLGLDLTNVNIEQTKTDLQKNKTALIKKIQKPNENIKSVDLELSSKIQSELLKRLHVNKNSFIKHSVKAEFESVNFATKATIKADGKELDINIEANLKRSFIQHQMIDTRKILRDPLTISLDGGMPTLGEKTFRFDIDSDGKSDQISALKNGSGFLAFDKNKNGYIDDGSELFGSYSGDGFKELQAYDDDKNGWIDENDKIFDKLRIWQKTDTQDRLVGIGEVGIGAIFLGNAKTEFSIKDLQSNDLKGQIRNSGFFVYKDGKAGVISQIDLVTKAVKEDEKNTLKAIKKLQEKSNGFSIYSQNTDNSNNKEESIIEKIKAKIKTLKAKLAKARPEEAGAINAQIVSLQAQILTFMKMGLK